MFNRAILITVMVILIFATNALAVDCWWSGLGGDQMWDNTSNWWSNSVPTAADIAYLDTYGLTTKIDSTVSAVCDELHVGEWNTACALEMTGGTLTVTKDWVIGGLDHEWGTAEGSVDMSGGTASAVNLKVGDQGYGQFELSGGTVNLSGALSISDSNDYSYLEVSGSGEVVLDGNQVSAVDVLISSGRITSVQGFSPDCDYNVTHSGKTTVFAVNNDIYKAYGPVPDTNSTVPKLDSAGNPVILQWSAGATAVSHDVYFGADFNDVNDANTSSPEFKISQPVADTNWAVTDTLLFGETYYWRIDANDGVNPPYKGYIWNVTIADSLTIEDFESYTGNTELRNAWQTINYTTVYLETAKVYDSLYSAQSMQLDYDNFDPPYLSEVTRTFANARDWNSPDTKVLGINIHGTENNPSDNMYVVLEDTSTATAVITYPTQAELIQQDREDFRYWTINLADFSGINLSQVKKITLGFGNKQSPTQGDAGTMYIDDIFISGPVCKDFDDDADITNNCWVDIEDLDQLAAAWLDSEYAVSSSPVTGTPVLWYKFNETSGTTAVDEINSPAHDGFVTSSACWLPGQGPDGSGALDLTGNDYVQCPPNSLTAELGGEVTICFWAKYGLLNDDEGCCVVHAGENLGDYMGYSGSIQFKAGYDPCTTYNDVVSWGAGNYTNWDYPFDQWNHIALTKSATTGLIRIYLNGEIKAEWDGAYMTSIPEFNEPDGYFTIGCWKWSEGIGGFYNGLIDDLRIYDYALSQAEIMTLADVADITQPVVSEANIDGDAKVDFEDFAIMASEWNAAPLWP